VEVFNVLTSVRVPSKVGTFIPKLVKISSSPSMHLRDLKFGAILSECGRHSSLHNNLRISFLSLLTFLKLSFQFSLSPKHILTLSKGLKLLLSLKVRGTICRGIPKSWKQVLNYLVITLKDLICKTVPSSVLISTTGLGEYERVIMRCNVVRDIDG